MLDLLVARTFILVMICINILVDVGLKHFQIYGVKFEGRFRALFECAITTKGSLIQMYLSQKKIFDVYIKFLFYF